MTCKVKMAAGFFAGIIQVAFLVIPFFSLAATASTGSFEVFSSGLGKVYGIDFDSHLM